MILEFKVERYVAENQFFSIKCSETCVHGRQPGQQAQTHHSAMIEVHHIHLTPWGTNSVNGGLDVTVVPNEVTAKTFALDSIIAFELKEKE